MIQERFQKWMPTNNLGRVYDVENITWGESLSFTLIADKKRIAQDSIRCFQLEWNSNHIIAYNMTDETYRADCWGLDFENDGRFYTSNNSDYIEAFKHKSPLFPDNAIHFLIVGTNTIIDVLAIEYPVVKVLE